VNAFTYYRSYTDGLAYYENVSRAKLPLYEQEYYGVRAAEKVFIRAAQLADNELLRAQCLWMAAKCWQKRCPEGVAKTIWERDLDEYYLNALKNPYFIQLDALSHTPFMKEAYSTCGYLRDYAKAKK